MKIKKILCSLIIWLWLINFSSAFSLTWDIPWEAFISYWWYSRSYLIDKNLNFRTDSQYKTFFYSFQPWNWVRNRALFWNDWKLAWYWNSTAWKIIAQWYYNTFCYTSISNLNYCNPWQSYSVPESYQTPIQEFYDLGAIYDSFYFDWWYASVIPYLCFLSSSRDIASCFYINITNNNWVINPLDWTAILQWIFDNPWNFDQTKFQDSPFSSSQTNTTVNQLSCPTIQQLINNFEPQYNTWLCYSNSLIYSWWQFQQVTPKTIFELYPQYQDFANDINTYYNYCKPPSTQETCWNAFTWKTEEWTLISKLPDNVTPVNVYNYCNYTLNLDPNQTICTISTGTLNPWWITVEDNINNINRQPITVVIPWTPPEAPEETGNQNIYWEGSVFDKYKQEEDEVKRRNIIGKAEDTIQTMREIYTKLTWIFRARSWREGIIPPLITWLIALIILFKLFKK